MAGFRSIAFVTLLVLITNCLALDMSIIDYNNLHGVKNNPDRTEAEMRMMYERWLVQNKKNYNALGERERRFEIFKDNLRFIDEHNSVPGRTYKVGLNKFADLTNEEYRQMYLGTRMARRSNNGTALLGSTGSQRYLFKEGDDLPANVDWRAKGAVVPVKDQGQCGKVSIFNLVFC